MFYKGKDTSKEKIAIQTKYQKAFRIPDKKQMLLYHYAGIETIWKILESDAFLARNIRFSNDSEEYKLGEKKIKEYAQQFFQAEQQEKFYERIRQGIQMFYMICFCREGDLLSQWRGYARDGVSLGMDFLEEEDGSLQKHTEMFTVLNNTDNPAMERYRVKDEYVRFLEMPYQVFYVDRGDGTEDTEEEETNGVRALEEAVNSFDDEDTRAAMLLNLIPFIKDKGFVEEAEYRILFDISDLGKTEAQNRRIMSKKIRYMEMDSRKIPNIMVEMGDGEKKCGKVEGVILGTEIRTQALKQGLKESEIDEIYQAIETELQNENITCKNSGEKRWIYIEEGKNQEDVMGQIEDILQQKGISIDYEKGIKIWCRGHLPIREVIIGPGEKKEKIRESLKHYMRNTYWLRYVEVRDSKIPLQS